MTARKGKCVDIRPHKHPTYQALAQPQKRGAKTYFTGSRLTYLEQHSDEYISLRGKSRHKFWHEFFKGWWARYPWRLPDNEEPPTNDLEKMKELSRVAGDEDEKSRVEGKLRGVRSVVRIFSVRGRSTHMIFQRITTWFSYRASVRNSRHEGGAWSSILKRAHQQLNPKPRCRSVIQQFMHERPEIIDGTFVLLYGDGKGMEPTDRMNKRYDIAKGLVATTYKGMVAELQQRAKETHERELGEWGLELEGIEEADNVQQCVFSGIVSCLSLMYAIL